MALRNVGRLGDPFVLTRRLSLRLLAPTVVVSAVLVAACASVALYLNHLHINASQVLSENVRSTQTAAQLETTTRELVRLLRIDPRNPERLTERVQEQNERMHQLRLEAESLANLDQERALVPQLSAEVDNYLQQWRQSQQLAPEQRHARHVLLAEQLERTVLPLCSELSKFNMSQVEASDLENQRIVSTLRWSLFAVGLAAPLAGLFLGYRVASKLHQSIYQLSVRIRDAAGQFSQKLGPVVLEEKGELTHVHMQMQSFIDKIGRVVHQLQEREHEVLRAEQLAAVGQVAAGVAHELRNPLTSIKMLVQTGLEGANPTLAEDELIVIEQEVRRMEKYIQTFLDFARPPCSERRSSDLVPLVRRALTLVEGRARQQKVDLVAELPLASLPLYIDPEQVHQVVVNLLLNALDALPHGGTVRVELDCRTETSEVELRVRDNGPGIALAVNGRLFEPFVTSKENGLGLGLSISKRLIEAHGGRIWGDNQEDGGAVFRFTLPLENAHACVAGHR
jgi:signal transduction histidine kinase